MLENSFYLVSCVCFWPLDGCPVWSRRRCLKTAFMVSPLEFWPRDGCLEGSRRRCLKTVFLLFRPWNSGHRMAAQRGPAGDVGKQCFHCFPLGILATGWLHRVVPQEMFENSCSMFSRLDSRNSAHRTGAPGHSWRLLGTLGHTCKLLGTPGRSWILLGAPGHSWVLLVSKGDSSKKMHMSARMPARMYSLRKCLKGCVRKYH